MVLPKSDSQHDFEQSIDKHPYDSRIEGCFGEWVGNVSAKQKLDFIKELENKLCWVVGSSYKKRYSGKSSPVKAYAAKIVKAILRDHGYQI